MAWPSNDALRERLEASNRAVGSPGSRFSRKRMGDVAGAWLIAGGMPGLASGDAAAPRTTGPTSPATREACAFVPDAMLATTWAPIAPTPADASADDGIDPGWAVRTVVSGPDAVPCAGVGPAGLGVVTGKLVAPAE